MTAVERRRTLRRRPAPDEPFATLRLRTGHTLTVINIGSLGGLLTGGVRLQPDARIELQLIAAGRRVPIPATVLRSRVCRLQPDAVCYESAVCFDAVVDIQIGYPLPASPDRSGVVPGTTYPSPLEAAPAGEGEVPAR